MWHENSQDTEVELYEEIVDDPNHSVTNVRPLVRYGGCQRTASIPGAHHAILRKCGNLARYYTQYTASATRPQLSGYPELEPRTVTLSKNICTRRKKSNSHYAPQPYRNQTVFKSLLTVQVRCLCHVMRQAESSRDTVQRRKNCCLRDAFVFLLWHTSRQPIAVIGGRCRSRADNLQPGTVETGRITPSAQVQLARSPCAVELVRV